MDKINLDSFVLYNNVRQDKLVNESIKILNELDSDNVACMEPDYFEIQRELLKNSDSIDMNGTYWQNHICSLIAESENRFSLMAEKGESNRSIEKLALRELLDLSRLYQIDWRRIAAIFRDEETSVCCMKEPPKENEGRSRDPIREAMESADGEAALTALMEYYRDNSCGIFEKYNAFLWDGQLVGVKNYDKITFEMLIGYERQKAILIENTEYFLQGNRANNVLLYGDRGTGKSSCVKALLNRFKDKKLKIISLNKNHIDHLYKILEAIAGRGCKFIVFIDDLSFEDTEVGYKHFKSVIDGGIEAQPSNILIYVTTNRRNIIKETWKDRGEGDDVHHADGMQERLSLADRFGLTITFSSPDKEMYLDIVKGIAKQEQLSISEHELVEEAIRWELRQNGRSGRAAKQFIQSIQSKNFKQKE